MFLSRHTHTPLVLTVRTTNRWVCPRHMIISPHLNRSTLAISVLQGATVAPPPHHSPSSTALQVSRRNSRVLVERCDPGQVCLSVCPSTWWPQIFLSISSWFSRLLGYIDVNVMYILKVRIQPKGWRRSTIPDWYTCQLRNKANLNFKGVWIPEKGFWAVLIILSLER